MDLAVPILSPFTNPPTQARVYLSIEAMRAIFSYNRINGSFSISIWGPLGSRAAVESEEEASGKKEGAKEGRGKEEEEEK